MDLAVAIHGRIVGVVDCQRPGQARELDAALCHGGQYSRCRQDSYLRGAVLFLLCRLCHSHAHLQSRIVHRTVFCALIVLVRRFVLALVSFPASQPIAAPTLFVLKPLSPSDSRTTCYLLARVSARPRSRRARGLRSFYASPRPHEFQNPQ